ncbi:FtsX-like permease family protein [Rathayibacter oskolensis]|uniref:FtsX-like permease family protein n=1 Tax=Rathayibacter oskolensis TaxID=1891671 RepID=A0A1X7PIF3_9MICO|nr:FtsX-like permease family protein [Rathayibacter oskolensis]SMH50438.1 FtsX-like permease family protein [Rathayibacter oskolensis]
MSAHTPRAAAAAPAMTVALAVLSLIVAAALVLLPALGARSATAALRDDLGQAGPARLDVTAEGTLGILPGAGDGTLPDGVDEVWGALDSSLRDLGAAQPLPLASALGEPGAATVLDAVPVSAEPGGPPVRASQLALAAEPGLAADVEVTEGSLPGPAASGGTIPIALGAAVATEMVWAVGERRLLSLPPGGTVTVELTGTFEGRDDRAPVWRHVADALRPALISAGADGTIARGTALIDPASASILDVLPIPARTIAWYPVSIDEIEGPEAELLAQQARTFTGRQQELAGGADPGYSFTTSLPSLLDDAIAAQRESDGFVWTAVSGPAVGGGVVLALIVLLLVRAREPGLAVLEARGASAARRRLALAGEAAVASAAGAAVGASAGVAVSLQLTGGVVIEGWAVAAVCALIVVAAGGAALGHRSALVVRGDRHPLLRPGAEALLVLATLAAVLALVQRAPLPFAGVLAPALLAVTGAVGAARLLPAVLGVVRRRGRAGTGSLALLASSRADGALVVVGVAGALAVALFSGALLTTVRAAVVEQASADVGADLAVRGPGLTAAGVAELAAVPGVADVAAVVADDPATVTVGASRSPMRIVVVDSAALVRVQAGLADRLRVPDGFAATEADGTVPVIASRSAAAEIGDAELSLRGHDLAVVATADDASPLTSASTWLLVDTATALELRIQPGAADVVLVGLDDPAAADAVRAALGPDADVRTAEGVAAQRLGNARVVAEQIALVGGVAGGVVAASAVLLLAALASAGARRRRAAVLTALGMPRSRIAALAVASATPPAAIGALAGVLVGLVLPFALVPLLALPSLDEAAVLVDPVTALVTVAAFLLAAGITVAATTTPRGPRR